MWMATTEDLLREAAETEALAALVSYGPDRRWLLAKAAELRHQAERARGRPNGRPRQEP